MWSELIWTMLCSRGRWAFTTYIKQMKLFSLVASAAVIGASFLVPNPATASVEELCKFGLGDGCSGNKLNYRPKSSGNSCPPGTRNYRTKGLFGLGARNLGCMTAYEAESLRRQNYQNIQNNINRNRRRNCTTNFIGRTAYTNCYWWTVGKPDAFKLGLKAI